MVHTKPQVAKSEAADRATPSHVLKFIVLIVKGTGRVALDREPQLLAGGV